MTYEASNQMFINFARQFGFEKPSVWTNGMAGIVAEMFSALLYLPADLVIQRLQVANQYSFLPFRYQDRDCWGVVKRLVKTEGVGGLLRGYWPYVATFGPDSAIWWMSYESFKRLLQADQSKLTDYQKRFATREGLVELLKIFFASASAGILSTAAISPFDVARTRLQLLEIHNESERKALAKGFFSVLRNIYREEGWHGLYKGIKPRIYISIPVSTISLIGYECLKEACLP